MSDFCRGYSKFCSGPKVSGQLRPLLARAYNEIHACPIDLHLLKESLASLVSFLCQPEYRTDANCAGVDKFFCVDDHWSVRWEALPKEYQLVLDDIGDCLHDTVSNPDVAENFQSTPEQLLVRIKRL